MLTAARLRELMSYDPETGIFVRLVTINGRAKIGQVVGSPTAGGRSEGGGYLQVCIDRKKFLLHRLAVLYMMGEWPSHEVDHRDLDRANNRWRNLRSGTSSQNKGNMRANSDSRSGIKGVYFDKSRGLWLAQITVCGQHFHLGRHTTAELAHEAYRAAAEEKFGDFARVA